MRRAREVLSAADQRSLPGSSALIDPILLLAAYRKGLFPMGLDDGDIGWFSPDPRGILPLETFHVPARLARVVRRGTFSIRFDTRFDDVMRACAERPDEGTWINDEILESYGMLHRLGFAHSVEAWQGDELAGGLYGVSLGRAFFGESMFHQVTDASKVALTALVEHLKARGFTLLDTQWSTPHLEQFGVIEISREKYLRKLADAMKGEAEF
jgi:leucyl/phenylalanyl-tRNA---protein transferase